MKAILDAVEAEGTRVYPDDVILLGRESAGVPDAVHEAAEARDGLLDVLLRGAAQALVRAEAEPAQRELRRGVGTCDLHALDRRDRC